MKRIIAIILALATVLALTACGAEKEAQQEPVTPSAEAPNEETAENTGTEPAEEVTHEAPAEETITDLIGREVTIVPGSYKRVVCIGAGALRMYSYVADVSLLCGVEDIDNRSLEDRPKMFDSVARPYVLAYGDVFETLPSCGVGGPNGQTAEAEKILSCNPDIVISEYEDVEKENALQEQIGVPVVTLRSGSDGVFSDAFKDTLTLLGKVFDREERANELIAFIEEETAGIKEKSSSVTEQPNVYICGLGNWGTTNHLATSMNYKPFEIANIKNVLFDAEAKGTTSIEEEKFVSIGDDIDIMIVDAAAIKNIRPLYAEDSTMFDSVKAFREGNVYLQMAYNAYYTNYEIALMNTWYAAKCVYPEAFADIDMTAKTNEITKMFLGKELAEEIFSCPASFGGYGKADSSFFAG